MSPSALPLLVRCSSCISSVTPFLSVKQTRSCEKVLQEEFGSKKHPKNDVLKHPTKTSRLSYQDVHVCALRKCLAVIVFERVDGLTSGAGVALHQVRISEPVSLFGEGLLLEIVGVATHMTSGPRRLSPPFTGQESERPSLKLTLLTLRKTEHRGR